LAILCATLHRGGSSFHLNGVTPHRDDAVSLKPSIGPGSGTAYLTVTLRDTSSRAYGWRRARLSMRGLVLAQRAAAKVGLGELAEEVWTDAG
jgi:hypothetical protein